MMKTYLYPDKKDWKQLLQRPIFDSTSLQEKVKSVLMLVKTRSMKLLIIYQMN